MKTVFLRQTRPHVYKIGALAAIAASALLFLAGCGSIELESRWQDVDVAIDGVNTEWNDNTVYIEDPGVVVGVSNDEEFIYLCLMTSNHKVQRQVMTSGFIVWMDAENDKNKDFGIRFPLGIQGAGSSPRDMTSPNQRNAGPPDLNKMFEDHVALKDEFEIIGPADMGIRRVHTPDAQGVEVKAGYLRGALIYELKVPVGRADADRHFTVDSNPGQVIGVCLESPEIDREEMNNRMGGRPGGGMGGGGGMPPGGGRGGMGGGGKFGGRGGGMGGPRNGGSLERPESFEVWATFTLATGT